MRKGILLIALSATFAALLSAQVPIPGANHVDSSSLKPELPWPGAYSRRSYQLGISISYFRALPYPDQKEWPGAYPVCTDEPRSSESAFEARITIPSDWKNAGVEACKFFYNSKVLNSTEEAGLILGDINSRTTFFFISEDGIQEPRLFRIDSGGPSGSYAELSMAFIAAYGSPLKISQERYQTIVGSIFANEIETWENATSSIRLAHFGEIIEVLQVIHSLKP